MTNNVSIGHVYKNKIIHKCIFLKVKNGSTIFHREKGECASMALFSCKKGEYVYQAFSSNAYRHCSKLGRRARRDL